jgi:DNA-binding NarL/FixJ family response regulator
MPTADESHEFTELEFKVILGLCAGLRNEEIAERCEITVDAVMNARASVYDKAAVSTQVELVVGFVRDALNSELRRRLGR